MNERQAERLSPLPKIGEGFREWSEAPSYEEGVGVDGVVQSLLCYPFCLFAKDNILHKFLIYVTFYLVLSK